MALKWIYGTFKTGATTVNNVLPVVRGSDTITLNISNEDFAVLELSKRDLPDPANWRTFLRAPNTMVAAIDDELAWNAEGAVLFAGFIKEARVTVADTIKIQVAGMREYASNRYPLPVFSGSVTDPKGGKTFQGSDYQRLLQAVMAEVYNSYSQASGSNPTPPTTQGTPTVAPNTGATTYVSLASSFQTIADILDDISITTSTNGNEYRFVPRWASSARTAIVWDSVTGSNTVPQLNYTTRTFNVNLDSNNFVTSASSSMSASDYATRIVGQSIAGNDTTPSDLTIAAISGSEASQSLLFDTSYNPGQEIPKATLTAQLAARLTFQKNLQESGEVGIVRNADPTWRTRVGAKVIMTSAGTNAGTSGVNLTARLAQVEFSLSNTEVKTTLVSPKPRYGKLPKSPTKKNPVRNPSTPGGGWGGGSIYTPGGGGGGSGVGGPIVPTVPPNTPPPGGGGGTVVAPPEFETPVYDSNKPFLTNIKLGSLLNQPAGANHATQIYPLSDFSGVIYAKLSDWSGSLSNNDFCEDSSQCIAKFNLISLANVPAMKLYKGSMVRDTASTMTELFDFDFKVLSTSWSYWLNDINIGQVYARNSLQDRRHARDDRRYASHSAKLHTVVWAAGDTVWVWVLAIQSLLTQKSSSGDRNPLAAAVVGTKLFKNSISAGTKFSWELVKNNIRDSGGSIFYPYTNESILYNQLKETYIYGGLRYDVSGVCGSYGDVIQSRVLDGSEGGPFPINSNVQDLFDITQTPYNRKSLYKFNNGEMQELPLTMPRIDFSDSQWSTIQIPGDPLIMAVGVPGYNFKLSKSTLMKTQYPYIVKRCGNDSTTGVFQMPSVRGEAIPATDESYEPQVFRELTAFAGEQTGALRAATSSLNLTYVPTTMNFNSVTAFYVKSWFVVLGELNGEWVTFRTKNNGQTWVKAKETNIPGSVTGQARAGNRRETLLATPESELVQRILSSQRNITLELLGWNVVCNGDYGVINVAGTVFPGTRLMSFVVDESM